MNNLDNSLTEMKFESSEAFAKYIDENKDKNEKNVLRTLKENGLYLKDVYYKLKNDKNIVLTAILQNIDALEFAHPRLKDDGEFLLMALKMEHIYKTGFIKFVSERLKNNEEFIISLLSINGRYLTSLHDKFKDNKYFVTTAVNNNNYSLNYASERLKNDKKFILGLIKLNPYVYVTSTIEKDEKFIIKAFKANNDIIKYIPTELKDNEYFLCHLNEITKLTNMFIYNNNNNNISSVSRRILSKINEDPEYLDSFLPVCIKPAK